ncbi:MAG: orotidine-5'-phosphate decarboxylase [Candidatus Altiarchaeota archaeon]|nr:orotidine-5'-phosphate decarboxylase [Candidatus Altiarchaeota archaeon]
MFLDLYQKVRDEKNSILCVGLDVVMQKFLKRDMGVEILEFCLDVVEKTSDYACAYKPNSQFILFDLNLNQLRKLNQAIHDKGCISILDHKLGDIGSTNLSALHWISEAGFDAFTLSPFAGNILETTARAHRRGLGVFVLTLMSNPESSWIQKESMIGGVPLYLEIAQKVREGGSDGVVVGATDNTTTEDIRKIREKIGEDRVFLCPGVGAQGGDPEKIIKAAGPNILINVSRTIVDSVNQQEKAKQFQEQFNKHR